jgi:acyl CoA:acetate/3-ketoacid CoA transferase alpha subunit
MLASPAFRGARAGHLDRVAPGAVRLADHERLLVSGVAVHIEPAGGAIARRRHDTEVDEGMLHWGLLAAAHRLPFLPIQASLGSDVLRVNPGLRTVRSPYADGEELVAMPALRLDAALIHLNRADDVGNGQYHGPDSYFDDLFCLAAERAYLACERIVRRRAWPSPGRHRACS